MHGFKSAARCQRKTHGCESIAQGKEPNTLQGIRQDRPYALQTLRRGVSHRPPIALVAYSWTPCILAARPLPDRPCRGAYGPDGNLNANPDGNHYKLAAG